jgi:predicted flap endonuclease-1-like 5' DNA nuclease
MSAFACCFWWFLLGLLLGWLLNWLLSKWTRKDDSGSSGGNNYNVPSHASQALSGAVNTGAVNIGAVTAIGASVALAAASGFKIKGNHDLEVIEGIGPKIAGLFTEHGAGTFDKVMNLSVPEMLAILEKGGSRFKLANPGSWAEQAKLCYENRWAELQMLQDSLSAGVNKSDSSSA